jgi:hypothetical protein
VVTVGGTQTLTGKTFTSPVINTPTGIVKGDVGLGNVDNTSDANKPISTATRAALDIRSDVRVRACSTTNITIATALNNADSLDGVTLATGDLVLVAGQSSAGENGIYVVGVTPTRHTEYATFNAHPGAWVAVQEGTTNADTTWLCTANTGGTLNTTALTFSQQGGPSGAGGRSVLLAADQTALQSAIGLTIGTNVQAFDALLTSIAGQAMIADRYLYGTGTDTVTLGTITTFGRSLVDDADATTALTTLGIPTSTFMKTVLDDTDATTARGTLGANDASNLSTGTLPDARLSSAATPFGKQAIYIPATAMFPRATNGPSVGNAVTVTNSVQLQTLDFDASFNPGEVAYFGWRMPASWNESTVTFQPVFSQLTTSAGGVVFELAAVAASDGDTFDAAYGTGQTSTKTAGTLNICYIGAESAAITVAGTPAAGDFVHFRVTRLTQNASDTLAIDARLEGITLFITTDAGHD